MLSFVCLFAVLSTGALAKEQFIVGGSDQDIASFPWQGSFRSGTSHICGCVFVGDTWVLTAAHCVGNTPSSYSVGFGSSERTQVQVFAVLDILEHPFYERGNGFSPNDIAVVTSEVTTGVNIFPADIALDGTNPGGTGWITGWGRTAGGAPLATTLQGTEIPIIDDAECAGVWGDNFEDRTMICVWDGPDGQIGSCNGDSGGPMTVGNTLYGLTSWGVAGCGTNYPSVYCKVGRYYDWICANTLNGALGC